MSTCKNMDWSYYLTRYKQGEWRATIFRDMILNDAQKIKAKKANLAMLDIGCGLGFDNEEDIQRALGNIATQYIGVEPDTAMEPSAIFQYVHGSLFEEAPIPPNSIDIAYAVMVMEHIKEPDKFWKRIFYVLKPKGVFWGFTVDARHWFVKASKITEFLKIKDFYLNKLHGKKGEERYENYPVFYRTNTPEQIEGLTKDFDNVNVLNFYREGQIDSYLIKQLQWINRAYDRYAIRKGWPGSLIAIRVQKGA